MSKLHQNYRKNMGNRFSSCAPTVSDENNDPPNISISDNLLKRLTQSNSREEIDLTPYVAGDDAEWMEKLRCMDRVHSEASGLTGDAFYQLLEKIERKVAVEGARKCPTEDLIRCLQDCTFPIKCRQVLDEFIDCVDSQRIEIIKRRIEENEQNRK